jgi:DNA-binding CsgD family transcriptional regulator
VLALSLDDAEAADAALAPLAAPFEDGVPDPIRPFFLPDEVEALIALGRLEPAEHLIGNFEAAARRLRRPWALMMSARCRALLLAAQGELDAASQAARDALALCEGLELRIEVARTLLVAGQLERRRRKKRAASEYLGRAATEFEEMGARLWAERARAELRRVGLRPSAPDELTESERRVAELAASGLKNREVAAQLYLSPKTVEATLARVYRKLEIHSRAELGARLGGEKRLPGQM